MKAPSILPPEPRACYFYFDKIREWLKEPLSDRHLNRIKQQCGDLKPFNEQAWFDPSYRQRLELYQPSEAAQRMLTEFSHEGVLINYVEVTADQIIADEVELQRMG